MVAKQSRSTARKPGLDKGKGKTARGNKGARRALAEVFRTRGYLREPDAKRREDEGKTYKKGYEVRLGVSTKREVTQVRKLLREAGLEPGKDYRHHNAYVVPLYGPEAVAYFRSLPKR